MRLLFLHPVLELGVHGVGSWEGKKGITCKKHRQAETYEDGLTFPCHFSTLIDDVGILSEKLPLADIHLSQESEELKEDPRKGRIL